MRRPGNRSSGRNQQPIQLVAVARATGCGLRHLGWGLAALCAGLCLVGCPNPNTYGTPRTVPKGKISYTVAVEAFGFGVVANKTTSTSIDPVTGQQQTTTEKTTVNGLLPVLPTYQSEPGPAFS